MNRLIFRRMALSTLLLSSIATPVFADADRTPPQAGNAPVTLSAASAPLQGSILITARIPDLLDLAERYAPETVQDWTDTLSRYNKAIRLNVQVLTLDTTGEVTAPAVQLATPVALTAAIPSLAGSAPAADLQLAGTDGILSAFATGTAASSTADFTVFAVPDSLSSAGLTGSGSITAAAAPALLPMTEDNGFFKAQAALAEAVESKDAGAVKHALGGLLEQYKDLTKKLEEAK
ncbi:hypothetical protein GC101_04555 [Paenibacillus sp. LMG 31459]|uniref:Bypass of forespore C C-terminal domain-containing protein n=1 Tax=Paenibacillus phytohabitans TaxID=2654978 RepID=A0ABX1YBJ4_9BACL|nr:hypothetical protein [Paenibacillus phytohabitans]NOU78146.1 hypothetical protein [Paenibacillus phytohabitans]